MPICPNGHDSTDEEYCDVCGRAMSGSPSPAAPVTREPEPAPVLQGATVCPACGTPLDGRFCEACGHDSLAAPPLVPNPPAKPSQPAEPNQPVTVAPQPAPPAPQAHTWTATVSADRDYYDTVIAAGGPDAGSIVFPVVCPDRYFPLRTNQISIGRRSVSRGIYPDIDLTGPPEDPGVSHLHAVLVLGPDGTLSIVDLGSSNGTTVNDSQTSLRANTPHPLSDGDQIHLGAWTTITVRAG